MKTKIFQEESAGFKAMIDMDEKKGGGHQGGVSFYVMNVDLISKAKV
jgi:hypothetical protein